jgi:anti-anti-sigma factor
VLLNVATRVEGSALVVTLEGTVGLSTLPTLSNALQRAAAQSAESRVILDLDALDTIDDAGLGIIMGFAGRSRTRGVPCICIASLPRIRQHLSDIGFDKAVAVTDSVSAALRSS